MKSFILTSPIPPGLTSTVSSYVPDQPSASTGLSRGSAPITSDSTRAMINHGKAILNRFLFATFISPFHKILWFYKGVPQSVGRIMSIKPSVGQAFPVRNCGDWEFTGHTCPSVFARVPEGRQTLSQQASPQCWELVLYLLSDKLSHRQPQPALCF